jgi:hypothetical protein
MATKRKKAKARKPKAEKPLSQPLPEAEATLIQEAPAPESPKPTILQGLFGSQSAPESANPSTISSEVTAEQSAELRSVPDVIGGDPQGGDEPGDELSAGELAETVSLLREMGFEEQDVIDLLGEGFEWLAERFDSEHWKLSERQGRLLGRPATKCANKLWLRVLDWLPDFLANLAKSSPEAAALVVASAIVVFPKVGKQVVISRTKKAQPKIIGGDTGQIQDQPKVEIVRTKPDVPQTSKRPVPVSNEDSEEALAFPTERKA